MLKMVLTKMLASATIGRALRMDGGGMVELQDTGGQVEK